MNTANEWKRCQIVCLNTPQWDVKGRAGVSVGFKGGAVGIVDRWCLQQAVFLIVRSSLVGEPHLHSQMQQSEDSTLPLSNHHQVWLTLFITTWANFIFVSGNQVYFFCITNFSSSLSVSPPLKKMCQESDLSLLHRVSFSSSASSASLLLHCQLIDSPGVALFFHFIMYKYCMCVFVHVALYCWWGKRKTLAQRCAWSHIWANHHLQ